MIKFRINARRAEFSTFEGHGIVSVLYDGKPPLYDKFFDGKKITDIEAALDEAHNALAGTNAAIYVTCVGRKPSGFDKWWSALGPKKYVKAQGVSA